MAKISGRARHFYTLHGWNPDDIDYLEENADYVEDHEGWALGVAIAPDGVVWVYPTAPGDKFPKSLWEEIKRLIEDNDNVVIPMNKNFDLVARAAKKYNGYLSDNMYLFGDQLQGIQFYGGNSRWSHSTS